MFTNTVGVFDVDRVGPTAGRHDMLRSLMRYAACIAALIGALPAAAGEIGQQVDANWWECFYPFTMETLTPPLHGRLLRAKSLSGERIGDLYSMWNYDLNVDWRVDGSPSKETRRVLSITINTPPLRSPEGRAIYGYLYGDGVYLGRVNLLSETSARRGYAADRAYFYSEALGQELAQHDLWTFVALRSDGLEVFRKTLAVPDRAGWQEAFLEHQRLIEQAWASRDARRTVADQASPIAEPVCLMSTAEARHIMEMGEI